MSKENKTVELKDEELEKVVGGDNDTYTFKCKICGAEFHNMKEAFDHEISCVIKNDQKNIDLNNNAGTVGYIGGPVPY